MKIKIQNNKQAVSAVWLKLIIKSQGKNQDSRLTKEESWPGFLDHESTL